MQALLDLRCELQPASEQPVLRAGPDSTSTSDGSRYWSDWEDFVRVIHAILRDIDAFLKRNDVDSRAKLDRATVDKRAMAYWTLIAQMWVLFSFNLLEGTSTLARSVVIKIL